jgi:hypothetical protein
MRLSRLVIPTLLVLAAAALVRALATRDGVGVVEYVVSVLLVLVLVGLALTTVRSARRAARSVR